MYEWMRRLKPLAPFGDLQRGFAMEVADPFWMLARQWQLGEHNGEDAGTPVGVTIPVAHAPIDPVDGQDPTIVPAEAIVEGAADDWWTPGRRIRVGRAVAPGLSAAERAATGFAGPLPAPYGTAFSGEVDGRAAWRAGLIAADHPATRRLRARHPRQLASGDARPCRRVRGGRRRAAGPGAWGRRGRLVFVRCICPPAAARRRSRRRPRGDPDAARLSGGAAAADLADRGPCERYRRLPARPVAPGDGAADPACR